MRLGVRANFMVQELRARSPVVLHMLATITSRFSLLILAPLALGCHLACRVDTPNPEVGTVARRADADRDAAAQLFEANPVSPNPVLTGTPILAMTGANGVVPCGADSGPRCFDRYHRVIVVVDVSNGGDESFEGLSVESLEFLADDGSIESRARAWIDIDRLGIAVASSEENQWALIGADGVAFDGTVPSGSTRLRIHAWLERPPRAERSRFRLVLSGGDLQCLVEGDVVKNAWPTG